MSSIRAKAEFIILVIISAVMFLPAGFALDEPSVKPEVMYFGVGGFVVIAGITYHSIGWIGIVLTYIFLNLAMVVSVRSHSSL